MPLTKRQRRAMLTDSPYLKRIKLELDSESVATFLEDATAASRQGESSEFATFRRIKNIPLQFYDYAHMSVDTFDLLLRKIGPKLGGSRIHSGAPPIPAELRLILTLRCLITSHSYRSLSTQFKTGRTTVADIVYEVCCAICEVLCEEYLPTPTEAHWRSITDNFYRKTGLPNCMGILEGVNMTTILRNNQQKERNMNLFMYMFLQTIIDDNGRLVTTEIRTAARAEDGSSTRTFPLSGAIQRWEMNFPQSKPLPNSKTEAPCILLADEQFPSTVQILKPAVSPVRSETQLFNAKLELAKRKPETIFRKMMSRWMVLRRPITCSEKITHAQLQAIGVLHNFILAHDGSEILDGVPDPGEKWQGVAASVIDDQCPPRCEDALRVRQIFQDYFVTQEQSLVLPIEPSVKSEHQI